MTGRTYTFLLVVFNIAVGNFRRRFENFVFVLLKSVDVLDLDLVDRFLGGQRGGVRVEWQSVAVLML